MIIYVDFNPILSIKVYSKDNININKLDYELGSSIYHSSRLTKFITSDVKYFFLKGGFSGIKIQNLLSFFNVDFTSIEIQDENRIDFQFNEKNILGISPRIRLLEINLSMDSLFNYDRSDHLFCSIIDINDFIRYKDLYETYFKEVNFYNNKLILQTIGISINEVIKYQPFFWILDATEVENFHKIKFESEDQLLNATDVIISAGIKHLLLTKGNILIYTNGKTSYKINSNTDINNVLLNRLSAVISGIAGAINQNCDIITSLRLAMAFHNINIDNNFVNQEIINKLIDRCEIIELKN